MIWTITTTTDRGPKNSPVKGKDVNDVCKYLWGPALQEGGHVALLHGGKVRLCQGLQRGQVGQLCGEEAPRHGSVRGKGGGGGGGGRESEG